MPKITKLANEAPKKRGRPKGSRNGAKATEQFVNTPMHTFKCAKGCIVKFISKNVEGQCALHHLPLELQNA